MNALIPSGQEWSSYQQLSHQLVASGMLPDTVKKPEQALAIMLKGWELGWSPMQSFAHINIIKGKPTISAEAMLGQIYKKVPGAQVTVKETTNERCVLVAKRPGGEPQTFAFTMEDAKRAGLTNKDNWRSWPRAMVRSRCVSEMARSVFPDALMGCVYTAEEVDPDIKVDESGNIIDVEHKASEDRAPPAKEPAPAIEPPPDDLLEGTFSAPPPPKKGVYDGSRGHQAALKRVLVAKKVPEELWERVGDLLIGLPSSDIDRVLGEMEP